MPLTGNHHPRKHDTPQTTQDIDLFEESQVYSCPSPAAPAVLARATRAPLDPASASAPFSYSASVPDVVAVCRATPPRRPRSPPTPPGEAWAGGWSDPEPAGTETLHILVDEIAVRLKLGCVHGWRTFADRLWCFGRIAKGYRHLAEPDHRES